MPFRLRPVPSLALSCLFLVAALTAGCGVTSVRDEGAPLEEEEAGEPVDDGRVAVCHVADGAFEVLRVDPPEVPDHLLHGDGLPSGAVPGWDGFVFSTGCAAQADAGGACPRGMALVDGFCIDRWEAALADASPFSEPTSGTAVTAPGVVPQGYISADVAAAACAAAGKRLCTSDEWVRACRGPRDTTYPYGDAYRAGACNEGRTTHPVVELFGNAADWSATQMNDPRLNQLPNSLDATGTNPACLSGEGVYDLHGNLHEWVADADGTFRGGFYVDAVINGEGCTYRTTAHGRSYHDYSTGFRCCADAR